MNISSYIPASWRKPIYGAFAVVSVLIGAIQVGIAAVGSENPEWLLVVLAVFPFLATAVGFTASANTNNDLDVADTLSARHDVDTNLFEDGDA